MNAAGVCDPIALGKHADHLRPTRVASIATIRRRIPFVRAKRSARAVIVMLLDRCARANVRNLVERSSVVWKRRRAGLSGDPVDVAAGLCVEHLLASEARRSRAMAVRQSAQDDLCSLGRDPVRLRGREAPTENG